MCNCHVANCVEIADHVLGLFVVPKKNTKSNAWFHFSLLDTEEGKVIENEQDRHVCKVRVLAKASNTQDLRKPHPKIYIDIGPKKHLK